MTAKLVDVVAVLVFVAIGRRSHDESGTLSGIIQTAAPFLIALAVSWVTLAIAKPESSFVAALIVWATTVAGGLLLRNLVFDDGTALSFMIVTTITLFVFIVGARLAVDRLF